MTTRTVVILLLFMILTWGGSAGIAFGVVELMGGGQQGEQGEQGERGERGLRGVAAGADTGIFTPITNFGEVLDDNPCTEAAEAYERGLSTPGLSEQQVIALYDVYVVRCGQD